MTKTIKKDKWVTLGTSVTASEKEVIEGLALKHNMTISKFVRHRLVTELNTEQEISSLNDHQKKLYSYVTKLYALNVHLAREIISRDHVNDILQDVEGQLRDLGYLNG